MADDNQQWPSEEEDFDAVHDGEPVGVAEAEKDEAPSEEPKTTSVQVTEPDAQPEEATPEEEHEEPVESTPEEAATEPEEAAPESETQAEPEQQTEEPVAPIAAPPKEKSDGKSTAMMVAIVVLLVAVVGLGLWSWSLNSDNKNLKNQVTQLNANPNIAIQKQTQDLITKVSKLIQLPTGETPTIANVSDASAAKKQSAFFDNAQNGDKVLMYVKAGEAILYRPSTNKIVLVAPLTFTNNTTSTTPATSSTTTKH